MEDAATRQHAHPNTVYHCLYGYYYLGLTRKNLARVYSKSERTISNWIRVYEENGSYGRASTKSDRKFTAAHRDWLVQFYSDRPLAYLDEAQAAFQEIHRIQISKSSVWRLIHNAGLTWKVLERRAMHIREKDVFRFVEELSRVDWSHQNLVFLDEVSFDNRGMIRRRGYSLKGQKLAIRGDFERKPRVSILAFINVWGIVDYYDSEGTFDRVAFVERCKAFVHSERGGVRQYPGRNSVWILDGATIHRHPEIVHYLRSVGVVVIFLPAYCPFFNPIEFLFGYVKKAFQRHYSEQSGRNLLPFIVRTFRRFENFSLARVFEHCGWMKRGMFSPVGPLSSEKRRVPDIPHVDNETEEAEDADEDELGFLSFGENQ